MIAIIKTFIALFAISALFTGLIVLASEMFPPEETPAPIVYGVSFPEGNYHCYPAERDA